MKKKIQTITILMLLILPISGVITTANLSPDTINISKKLPSIDQTNEINNLTITLKAATLFTGVDLEISNTGSTPITEIKWHFQGKPVITGARLFRKPIKNSGTIDELPAGETTTIPFRPFQEPRSPIGLANTYLNATIKLGEDSIYTQKQSFLIIIFLLGYKNTYIDISPAVAYSMFLNNSFDLIIDVVGLDIYNNGHLPGAVNYVWADGTLNQKIPTLDKNLTYLVYCHTDPPSTASAQALVDAGITKTYRLEGNYAAWKNAGYPTET